MQEAAQPTPCAPQPPAEASAAAREPSAGTPARSTPARRKAAPTPSPAPPASEAAAALRRRSVGRQPLRRLSAFLQAAAVVALLAVAYACAFGLPPLGALPFGERAAALARLRFGRHAEAAAPKYAAEAREPVSPPLPPSSARGGRTLDRRPSRA